jgi:hypothetical protein
MEMDIRYVLVAAAASLLGGCAVALQHPVELAPNSIGPQAGRVGVAMTAFPAQDTEVPGASCLLCLAFASASNGSLTTHAKTLPYEDLQKLRDLAAALLRKKGTDATVIPQALDLNALGDYGTKGPNIATKDFTPLKQKLNADRLLVFNVNAAGFVRNYSAYIPTSNPMAMLRGQAFIVNLSNNTYEWYLLVDIKRSAEGAWDEPPKFPGLTNAYFQVLELAKEGFLNGLSQ